MTNSTIAKIAALLAKAERSDNEHEAEAYLMKAQSLATQASVDLAVARARTAKLEAREQPLSKTITVGEPGDRANKHLVSLFLVVAHANDLRCDIARNSSYVIAYGMPSDIDVVETMWGSLAVQMTSSAHAWLALGQWRGETYQRRVNHGYGRYSRETKTHTMGTARTAFYLAFIERVGQRIMDARNEELERQRNIVIPQEDLDEVPVPAGGPVTGALVLKAKEAEIAAFHRRESKARGSWGGYSGGVGRSAGSASSAGREAGSRARLSTARGIGGKGPGVGS